MSVLPPFSQPRVARLRKGRARIDEEGVQHTVTTPVKIDTTVRDTCACCPPDEPKRTSPSYDDNPSFYSEDSETFFFLPEKQLAKSPVPLAVVRRVLYGDGD